MKQIFFIFYISKLFIQFVLFKINFYFLLSKVQKYQLIRTDRIQERFQMKLQIKRDLDLSQMRFSVANNFMYDSRQDSRKLSTTRSSDHKRKGSNKLKRIISKQKIEQIKRQFVNKLKLLVPHKIIPPQLLIFRRQPTNFLSLLLIKLEQTQGCKIGSTWNLVWKFVVLIKMILLVFVTSFLLAFQEAKEQSIFMKIVQFSILFSLLDMTMNFTFQRFQNNRNLKCIKSISKCYLKNDFLLDFLALLMSFLLRVDSTFIINVILLILSLIKLIRSVSKVQILQHVYITNVFHQRYYSIARVLMFNFIIAHFIAIITILMSQLNPHENWITLNNLSDANWSEVYTWAYYWAVNIMLTVGFGDFTASNRQQALVLIFVQTISCIMFAYNINTVGSILSDMKQKQRQRKNQLRILLKMSKDNQVQKETVQKAVNYVDESFNIKSKFVYEDHDSILATLPECIQSQYKRQSHRKMLLQLPLACIFSRKSLMNIAEKICRKLAHPQEIVWKKNEPCRMIILNKGKLGLSPSYGNSKLNGQIIQNLQVHSNKSKLLSMNFFKNQKFQFDLKSITYCVIYHLSTQQFAEALTQKSVDYEVFCSLRDKAEFRLESGQLYQCNFCPQRKHDYFNCPKMHLILIKRYVILKNILIKDKQNFKRSFVSRTKYSKMYMKQWKKLKSFQESFINQTQQNLKQQAKGQKDENSKNPLNLSYHEIQIFSQKIAQSARSNLPLSSVFRDYDIQKLNTILVAKMNEKQLCLGFWNIQCDTAYNFKSYLKNNNSQNLKQFPLASLYRMTRSNTYTSPFTIFQ